MNKREQAQRARKRMEDLVKADPRFLYVYSPSGTRQNERWVFTDITCLSLAEALGHVEEDDDA